MAKHRQTKFVHLNVTVKSVISHHDFDTHQRPSLPIGETDLIYTPMIPQSLSWVALSCVLMSTTKSNKRCLKFTDTFGRNIRNVLDFL